MGDTLNLRFRHTQGDVGPLKLPVSTTVQTTKERLISAWPTDGPISLEPPSSPAEVKLILSGKFLESSETLEELKPHMGELKADSIVTVHVIVRVTPTTKASPGKLGDKEDSGAGCACCVM